MFCGFKESSYLCTRKMHRLVPCMCLIVRDWAINNGREGWSGSSVGLEQQPSKLWVKGSNPFRITRPGTARHKKKNRNTP